MVKNGVGITHGCHLFSSSRLLGEKIKPAIIICGIISSPGADKNAGAAKNHGRRSRFPSQSFSCRACTDTTAPWYARLDILASSAPDLLPNKQSSQSKNANLLFRKAAARSANKKSLISQRRGWPSTVISSSSVGARSHIVSRVSCPSGFGCDGPSPLYKRISCTKCLICVAWLPSILKVPKAPSAIWNRLGDRCQAFRYRTCRALAASDTLGVAARPSGGGGSAIRLTLRGRFLWEKRLRDKFKIIF